MLQLTRLAYHQRCEAHAGGKSRRKTACRMSSAASALPARKSAAETGCSVCGACSVILNGEVVRACTKKSKDVRSTAKFLPSRASARHPLPTAPAAGGVYDLQQRTVRILLPRLHRILLRAPESQPEPHPQRCPRMVPQAPQHLPLHRL
jgi:hypothetical protein